MVIDHIVQANPAIKEGNKLTPEYYIPHVMQGMTQLLNIWNIGCLRYPEALINKKFNVKILKSWIQKLEDFNKL